MAKERIISAWLLMCLMILMVAMAHGAARQGEANVEQVDLFDDWVCPAVTFSDIPGLSLSLTTAGGPLLLMMTANVFLPEGSAGPALFDLDLVLDGQQISADRLTWQFTTPLDVITFSRVYFVEPGTHMMGMKLRCPPVPSVVIRAWMMAYELPLIKK